MTETQVIAVSNELEQYGVSVAELYTLLEKAPLDENQIEQHFLKIITLRESLNAQLREKGQLQLNTDTLRQTAAADEKLYHAVQLMRRLTKINPAKWQYILPEPENAGWWWRLHQVPVWMDDKIEYENRFSPALIPGIILIVVSFIIIAFSTQQMWASGQQWIGNVSLLGQVLIGAGLISANGREVAARMVNQFVNMVDDGITASSTRNRQSPFPLAKRRTNLALGILGAAILFFSFVAIFTMFVVPAAARWFHEMGVRAVEERNVSRAEFYLELAVAVQPDFAPLPLNFSGAPSFAQLGNLYREIGNLPAAREAYENALGEDARTVSVHYRLAEIYMAEGNLTSAFAVLDRALMLLSQHLSGETRLPIGSDSIDSEREAHQLTYLTLITRAEAFLQLESGHITALRDLDNARLTVETHPDLFITQNNMGENQPERILTTKLHVLYAHALTALNGDACAPQVLDEWRLVRRLSRFASTSNEQLWLDEANVTLENCR